MPLFGHRPAKPTDEERQQAEVDLDRIRQGGIPLGAEQRLARIAQQQDPFFTSDLSAKEYALVLKSGLQPLAQVMGSSVVQHGWQSYGTYNWSMYGGGIQEMPGFAEPWNIARQRSFERLSQEAWHAGADTVIGIEIGTSTVGDDPNSIEYTVFGTAARETTLTTGRRSQHEPPRLSALSAQDTDKLRRIGAETIGVIGHTMVVSVLLSPWANQQMSRWWGNQEMTEVTQGVYDVRRRTMHEVEYQARELGASEMVISTLRHDIHHHEYDQNGYTQHVFVISMHVLGTAIRLGAHPPHPSPLPVPMMTVNLGDQT